MIKENIIPIGKNMSKEASIEDKTINKVSKQFKDKDERKPKHNE